MFFFQAEDGIRDHCVTGVQTCALPILLARSVVAMIEKEKLLPVRMQVVNKAGGGSTVAASYLAEKAGEPHTIGFFTGVWLTSPLTSAEAKVTLRDLTTGARLVLEPALIAGKA